MNITEFSKWLELVENHGLSLIMFGIILMLFFIPWVRDLKNKAERTDSKTLEKTIELERLITLCLAQVANEFNCQWAVLWQFHNGSLSASRVPFMRMSVTHEFSADGVAPRSESYQGIPISVFIDAVSVIQKQRHLQTSLKSPYPSIVNSYKRDGVACGALIRVDDNHGNMMGVLSVSYSKLRRPFTAEKLTVLDAYAVRLSSYLEQMAAEYRHPTRRIQDMK